MKKFFKPYNLLLYFLSFLVFFLFGILYARFTNAAEGQGLAGGAIVLGYGVAAAVTGLLISVFVAPNIGRTKVFLINKIFGTIFFCLTLYFTWNYFANVKPKRDAQNKDPREKSIPKRATNKNVTPLAMNFLNAKNDEISIQLDKTQSSMGLGMFSPNVFETSTLYFYDNITLGKGILEHIPTDSITYQKSEYGGFEIVTAPPWLVPEHLKLDYDMLYFKIQTLGHEFLEVTVNTKTGKTAFVDRYAGKILYWPQFLMSVHSVEFLNANSQAIHERPFKQSGIIPTKFTLMRPLKIKNEWMYVEILNDNFEVFGKGWIKWTENGKLLITYSLLS